jgi:hypothetical protein
MKFTCKCRTLVLHIWFGCLLWGVLCLRWASLSASARKSWYLWRDWDATHHYVFRDLTVEQLDTDLVHTWMKWFHFWSVTVRMHLRMMTNFRRIVCRYFSAVALCVGDVCFTIFFLIKTEQLKNLVQVEVGRGRVGLLYTVIYVVCRFKTWPAWWFSYAEI